MQQGALAEVYVRDELLALTKRAETLDGFSEVLAARVDELYETGQSKVSIH